MQCILPGGSIQSQILPHVRMNEEVFKRGLQSVLKAPFVAPNGPLPLNKLTKQ